LRSSSAAILAHTCQQIADRHGLGIGAAADSRRHATAIIAAISVSATSATVTERALVHQSAAANAIDSINVASSSSARELLTALIPASAQEHHSRLT
jgi:hypothetical protein